MIKKISVASTNPVKIQATREGFAQIFSNRKLKIQSFAADSGVSDQPLGSAETLEGAAIRARKALENFGHSDYGVGIEGGIEKIGSEYFTFAWVVIASQSQVGKARTAAFLIPEKAVKQIFQGKELGLVMDEIFQTTDSKRKQGAVGILTNGTIDRKTLYVPAVICALIPFIKKDLFKSGKKPSRQ